MLLPFKPVIFSRCTNNNIYFLTVNGYAPFNLIWLLNSAFTMYFSFTHLHKHCTKLPNSLLRLHARQLHTNEHIRAARSSASFTVTLTSCTGWGSSQWFSNPLNILITVVIKVLMNIREKCNYLQ